MLTRCASTSLLQVRLSTHQSTFASGVHSETMLLMEVLPAGWRLCLLSLQSPPLSLRCEAMQSLLVQLLQQLHGTTTPSNQVLQRLLLSGCCTCLQSLHLKSGATNHRVGRRFIALPLWLV